MTSSNNDLAGGKRLTAIQLGVGLVCVISLVSFLWDNPALCDCRTSGTTLKKEQNSNRTRHFSNYSSTTPQSSNKYPTDDGNEIGWLSELPREFFQALRDKIDDANPEERCARYGFGYNSTIQRYRKIYFGAAIASEPWELLEIVGTETMGIYEGVVFVESNRTQNFSPRPVTRLGYESTIADIFGTSKSQVRFFVNENRAIQSLVRESAQRDEILVGWKELGMQPDDVGILSDPDEVFSRDFLRAVQMCEIDQLDYDKHDCHPAKGGIRAYSQVYEGSPECITDERVWWQPSMFVGHCIQGIGNSTKHPIAPSDGWEREKGWGGDWNSSLTHDRYPLVTGADFRSVGAPFMPKNDAPNYGHYTSFHFHNFFTKPNAIRFKYKTYGHPDEQADKKTLEDIHGDVALMVRCVKEVKDPQGANSKRISGGFDMIRPFRPIYFHDPVYRKKRQAFLKQMILREERSRLPAPPSRKT